MSSLTASERKQSSLKFIWQQTGCVYRAALWRMRATGTDMFSKSLLRTGFCLRRTENSGIKCVLSAFLSTGNPTHSTLIDGDKQKTMDDLGGPSFLTSLYWLFGKGYFNKTQQMQVSDVIIFVLPCGMRSVFAHLFRIGPTPEFQR